MNTIKTIISLSIIASAAAHAAAPDDRTAYLKKVLATEQQVAIDTSDNRGMSLLFDEKIKPGALVVSSVSTFAKEAGVLPGDVLKQVCGQPANNLRAYGALAAVVGKANILQSIGRYVVTGNVPLSAVKVENDKLVLSKSVQLQGKFVPVDAKEPPSGPDQLVTVPAGEEIKNICLPVHSMSDYMAVVAPFDTRLNRDGQLLPGGWVPMQYQFERYSYGLPVYVGHLTNWNPPQQVMAQAK
ncbi:hypothetical protein [Duganella callida]|uniref:PDZ domain-containing protein n=1 Tax=Duganella callida TaxID=2561932 RepID=A0A4Y9S613_9BURK|nr:hypothetical protein [Duganella callida]TFW15459.1 hypothetical protein E4L98_26635 [Duganella callida]